MTAHETGCRGITIYRDGSREKQVLETKKESSYYDKLAGKAAEATKPEPIVVGQRINLKSRPDVLNGRTYKIMTPLGKAFISINEDENGDIFEVFINVGRAGSDITADAEAIGRLISLTFRIPSDFSPNQIAQKVITQLRGIGGSSSTGFGSERIRSLADAVAKVIEQHLATRVAPEIKVDEEECYDDTLPLFTKPKTENTNLTDMCPECGSASLRFIEGCRKCELCGFSKC